jgi:hypothetical protein
MIASDLAALWRQYEDALAEVNASDLDPVDDHPAWQRHLDAQAAIEAARPTDLTGLSVQARLIADHLRTGRRIEHAPVAEWVASQLETMAATA